MSYKTVIVLVLSTAAVVAAAASVGSMSSSSEVKESTAALSCCDSPTLRFKPQCEITFSINDKPIAYSNANFNNCKPPCLKIEDGLMTLDACLDVNVTIVCLDPLNMIDEERIYYQRQTCSGNGTKGMAHGNHGSVGLLLLAVMIGGWFVNHLR